MAKHHNEDQSADTDWLDEQQYEGQLAIDAYQTEDHVVVKAPVAGVRPENLEIAITDEVITVKGERHDDAQATRDQYFTQECYWGAFSRSYLLPISVEADQAEASLQNGILTITIPKLEKTRTRIIKVKPTHADEN